jgi:hypothetical protein
MRLATVRSIGNFDTYFMSVGARFGYIGLSCVLWIQSKKKKKRKEKKEKMQQALFPILEFSWLCQCWTAVLTFLPHPVL